MVFSGPATEPTWILVRQPDHDPFASFDNIAVVLFWITSRSFAICPIQEEASMKCKLDTK